MLDRITGLFRRVRATSARPAAAPARTAPAPATPAADAAQARAAAEAASTLDSDASPATATQLATRTELPADLRCRALARVSDPAVLRTLALQDKVARVRLAAAERLTAPEDLEILRRDSSDKAVQRHARDALKAQRTAAQAAQETRVRIEHLLGTLEQQARRAFEPLYDARVDSLAQAWQAVADAATPAERERYAELLALCRDTIARHAGELAAREQVIAARQEQIAACNELETVVTRLQREDLGDSVAAVTALRTTQYTRWEEAVARTPADAPLAARYATALAQLDAWLAAVAELPRAAQALPALAAAIEQGEDADDGQLDEWQAQLDALPARQDWPQALHPPALLAELDALRTRLQAYQRARRASLQDQLAQLRRRRHALRRLVDEGQLRTATRSLQALRRRIDALPAREAGAERAALAPVEEALARLHDWYAFASVPKKTELCVLAEELAAGTDTDIEARATQVRDLRERWNTLCAADPDADPELRTRFEAAIATAWAPCAAWYAELRRQQDDNLAQRAALCAALTETLAALTPAEYADAPALARREREARATWKTLEPVRWPEARALQEQFGALTAQLRTLQETARAQQLARRQALVDAARALVAHEPLDTAITQARKLQDDWKQGRAADPRDERRLWNDFRAALDAVFARRDAAREEERQARAAAQAAAEAQRAAEDARRQERIDAKRAQRRAEITAALATAAAETATLDGQAVDTAALQLLLDALPPRSALTAALSARSEQLRAGMPVDAAALAANGETLLALTLDLEILAGRPSPPEQAAARMARQVGHLAAALRGARNADTLRALADQWLATGPVTGALHAACLARVAELLDEA